MDNSEWSQPEDSHGPFADRLPFHTTSREREESTHLPCPVEVQVMLGEFQDPKDQSSASNAGR
jgi:hypothetical protein